MTESLTNGNKKRKTKKLVLQESALKFLPFNCLSFLQFSCKQGMQYTILFLFLCPKITILCIFFEKYLIFEKTHHYFFDSVLRAQNELQIRPQKMESVKRKELSEIVLNASTKQDYEGNLINFKFKIYI